MLQVGATEIYHRNQWFNLSGRAVENVFTYMDHIIHFRHSVTVLMQSISVMLSPNISLINEALFISSSEMAQILLPEYA
jgi:hypothetical protein